MRHFTWSKEIDKCEMPESWMILVTIPDDSYWWMLGKRRRLTWTQRRSQGKWRRLGERDEGEEGEQATYDSSGVDRRKDCDWVERTSARSIDLMQDGRQGRSDLSTVPLRVAIHSLTAGYFITVFTLAKLHQVPLSGTTLSGLFGLGVTISSFLTVYVK